MCRTQTFGTSARAPTISPPWPSLVARNRPCSFSGKGASLRSSAAFGMAGRRYIVGAESEGGRCRATFFHFYPLPFFFFFFMPYGPLIQLFSRSLLSFVYLCDPSRRVLFTRPLPLV